MKILNKILLACGLTVACFQADAALTMRLSADGGLNWTNVADNGSLDFNGADGVITYAGPGGNWTVIISTGDGKPAIGSATAPNMDTGTTDISSGPATLIVQMSDTDFTSFPNETYIAGTTTTAAGTLTFNVYRDSGNVLFGSTANYGSPGVSPSPTAVQLFNEGPFASGTSVASNGVTVPSGGSGPYSLTLETLVTHFAAGTTLSDTILFANPPTTCNCTLTFSGPPTLTVCDGDAIPDVTATNVCLGAAPVGVPVTVVGSTTTTAPGVCPQIIIRTNQATDGCGNLQTLVQTITVNCKPDCTITPSVTTALAGNTYTASVANAGAGASYDWNILNGTITAGQNTPTITWKAGANTSIPVSIMITVTNGTGCFSSCTACVKLTTPPPPPFGKGDAATMGFWQNKNGQGLINNAPAGPPTLANWLATTFPCLYGATAPAADNLTGKPNSAVAALFVTKFSATGQKKQECQVFSVALACYFTDTNLGGGTGPKGFGFNQTPGGTGAKLFNVGPYGTALGLVNNTAYPILEIMQHANNVRCGNQSASLPFDLFNSINQGGDIK
jgi:hypothetical protein